VKKIAYLRSVATPDSPVDEAFIDELVQRGFVEGMNLAILGGSGNEVFPIPTRRRKPSRSGRRRAWT